jgi:hypothetical protein
MCKARQSQSTWNQPKIYNNFLQINITIIVFIWVSCKDFLSKLNNPRLDVAEIPIKTNFPSGDPLI